MLLGRKQEELLEPRSHKPPLACEEILAFLHGGAGILGDVEQMSQCLRLLLPRLATCRVDSDADWQVLELCSQFAQRLGSRYMAKCIAWCAAANAHLAEGVCNRILCVCARMPGGDLKLHTVVHYLSEPSIYGYHCGVRLGIEAFWREEPRILDLAIARTLQLPEDRLDCIPCVPEIDLLLLRACREKLDEGIFNLAEVFGAIGQLEEPVQRAYQLEAMRLFLAGADSATVGMFAQGFELFGPSASAQYDR